MNKIRSLLLLLVLTCSVALAADETLRSTWAASDQPVDTDVNSSFWRGSVAIYMDSNPHGKPDPKYRTEIRSRWTRENLYFLFVCPYEELYLKPNPNTSEETNELWNWDVAEVFIGSDFQHIRRYKEFEMSPRGEWIDLDIELDKPHDENGWKWNSGFEVSARIDPTAHVWYGAMKIPYTALDNHPAAPGNTLRINFFRSQGPASARHQIAWQAPMSNSFHVPERFGVMELAKMK
jgi:Carbohydrate family 9 binding domain-like